jgi:5'-3' exonuclease
MKDHVLLIDLSACFWQSWHSSANDELSAARDRTLAQVRRLAADEKHVAICCDAPDGNTFRKNIYADYKANRPAKDKAAVDEMRQTCERLAMDGYPLWTASGFEADDVIASAVEEAKKRDIPVRIASADKDLLQLVSDTFHVTVISTRTGEVYTEAEVFAKFGVPPSRMRDFLALKGDKSDNVPGVPRVGDVTAAQLITTYGSIEQVYEAVEKDEEPITPAVRQSLKENRSAASISRELVTLRTDATIPFDEVFDPRKTKEIPVREDYFAAGKVAEDALEDMVDEVVDAIHGAPDATPPEGGGEPAPAPERTTTALSVRPRSYELELQPRNVESAWRMAKTIYQSRLYAKFPNAESIFAIIVRGREMGLSALTSLDCFHVIQGKPVMSAWLIIAKAREHPDCEYFQCIESTDKQATWETKNRRNPSVTRLTYTIEMARAAGLVQSGGGWVKNPADMNRKAGGVKLARMEYSSAALGLYSPEEFGQDYE